MKLLSRLFRRPAPLAERGPLRVMFVLTSMPVGGAETLLASVIRGMDRSRYTPEICCLKDRDPLGEVLAQEVPVHANLIGHKFDVAVLARLARLFLDRQVDAVITVGTGGDKMFWGRLAAKLTGVPVIASALHSTGLPDRVERSNRWLTPITDAFIAVAEAHGRYIGDHEGCPRDKVRVIPNGVDVQRFRDRPALPSLRAALGIPTAAPVVGIIAALRPEKQHELFLRMAARVRAAVENAHFLIVGDGVCRPALEQLAQELGIALAVHFAGTRGDVEQLLPLMDAVVLTSKMEANPVSILEAMAACRPVVVPAVGSIPEVVTDHQTGRLYPGSDESALVSAVTEVLRDRQKAAAVGQAARQIVVDRFSLEGMVRGYEQLVAGIYASKCAAPAQRRSGLPAFWTRRRPAGG